MTRDHRSDLEVALDAFAPSRAGSLHGDHFEAVDRPSAFAQIEIRGLDVAKVVARIDALVAELRKLDESDLMLVWLHADPEGLWKLASQVGFRGGAGLPDPARVKAWHRRAQR